MEAAPGENQPSAPSTNETKSSSKKHKKGKHEHHSKKHRSKHHTDPAPLSDAVEGRSVADTEDWTTNHDRVGQLCSVFPNNICCDCNESGTQWASVNHGVFVCIRCAGVHRSLGVHISKVKSTSMDRWAAAEVALMEAIGNRRGEAFYCSHPPSEEAGRLTRHSSNEEVKRFIERKYANKEFAVSNVDELLRKIHKQVGYQQPKQQKSGSRADGELNNAAPDRGEAGKKKVDPEQVMRALYGDAATSELTSKIKSMSQKKEPRSQTVHGTFGVVNVPPEEYTDRVNMVLRAFEIDQETAEPTPHVGKEDREEAQLSG